MHQITDSEKNVASIGEVKLIQLIGAWLGPVSPAAPSGMGDDCALLPAAQLPQLITTDALSYGQHFDPRVSPQQAGAKLIKRNLSDIAAMGGTPHQAVLALLCGPDLSLAWLQAFFEGVRETCLEYRIQLVGGDVSTLPRGQFSAVLSLLGTAESHRLRNTAQAGDCIYVTGELGGSIRKKHWDFTPRMQEGRWLAQQSPCSALMDLTDGLAKDLAALIPAGCSAALELDRIPISGDALACARESGRPAMQHAWCDGEDYELLFTVPENRAAELEMAWVQRFPQLKLSRIGQFCPQACAPYIDASTGAPIPWTQGFEHLKSE